MNPQQKGRGRTAVPVKKGDEKTTLPARAGGEAAVGPSLIPQVHGGALLSGGKPGTRGPNQNARQRAQAVRGELVAELEGAAKDLSALLETARESDGDRLRCKARYCSPPASSTSCAIIFDIFSTWPTMASSTASLRSARARRRSAAARPPPALPGFPTLSAPPCACATICRTPPTSGTAIKEGPSGVSAGVRAPEIGDREALRRKWGDRFTNG